MRRGVVTLPPNAKFDDGGSIEFKVQLAKAQLAVDEFWACVQRAKQPKQRPVDYERLPV